MEPMIERRSSIPKDGGMSSLADLATLSNLRLPSLRGVQDLQSQAEKKIYLSTPRRLQRFFFSPVQRKYSTSMGVIFDDEFNNIFHRLQRSRFGISWALLQMALTMASCCVYIAQSYHWEAKTVHITPLDHVDLGIGILFTLDIVFNFLASKNPIHYFANIFSYIDIATVVPIFAQYIMGKSAFGSMSVIRVLKIFRLMRLFKTDDIRLGTETQRALMELLVTVTIIIVGSACLIQLIEIGLGDPDDKVANVEKWTFHDAVYMIVITISTVGYGDLTPLTQVGRMFITFVVLLSIVVIPFQSARLLEIVTAPAQYYGSASGVSGGRVIVVGDMNPQQLVPFLTELFHADHNSGHICVSLLCESYPSEDLKRLLELPVMKRRVVYIRGNPLHDIDLERAGISVCSSVFVLNRLDKNGYDSEVLDRHCVMRALSVDKWFRNNSRFDAKVFTQLRRSQNKSFLLDVGMDGSTVQCIDELRMSAISTSLLCPGFMSFYSNLFTSQTDSDMLFMDASFGEWYDEYLNGSTREVYTLTLSPYFHGMKIGDVVKMLYYEHSVMVVGIQRPNLTKELLRNVTVNPDPQEVISTSIERPSQLILIAENVEDVRQLERRYFSTDPPSDVEAASDFGHYVEMEQVDDQPSPMKRVKSGSTSSPQSPPLSKTRGSFSSKHLSSSFKSPSGSGKLEFVDESEQILDKRRLNYMRNVHREELGKSFAKATRRPLSSCTISQVNFKDHIVLCTVPRRDSVYLIRPLRNPKRAVHHPIVFLSDRDIDEDTWEPLSHFDDVWYMKGSALELNDLKKASVTEAYSVLLSIRQGACDDARDSQERDVIVCLTVLNVERLKCAKDNREVDMERLHPGKPHIVSELSNPLSSKIFTTGKQGTKILTQKFWNSPLWASGRLLVENMFFTLICQSHFVAPCVMDFFYLVGGQHNSIVGSAGTLFCAKVPSKAVGAKFGKIFDQLTSRHILPIGIVRADDHSQCCLGYVYTCPPPSAIVKPRDSILLFAEVEPVPDESQRSGLYFSFPKSNNESEIRVEDREDIDGETEPSTGEPENARSKGKKAQSKR